MKSFIKKIVLYLFLTFTIKKTTLILQLLKKKHNIFKNKTRKYKILHEKIVKNYIYTMKKIIHLMIFNL